MTNPKRTVYCLEMQVPGSEKSFLWAVAKDRSLIDQDHSALARSFPAKAFRINTVSVSPEDEADAADLDGEGSFQFINEATPLISDVFSSKGMEASIINNQLLNEARLNALLDAEMDDAKLRLIEDTIRNTLLVDRFGSIEEGMAELQDQVYAGGFNPNV